MVGEVNRLSSTEDVQTDRAEIVESSSAFNVYYFYNLHEICTLQLSIYQMMQSRPFRPG